MYSIRQLTLAFGLLLAASSAIASPDANPPADSLASTANASPAAVHPTVYARDVNGRAKTMRRGRADVQAVKRDAVATPKQGRVVLADTYGQPTSFYISKNLNSNGEFGVKTTDPSQALLVTYNAAETGVQSLSLSSEDYSWPYLAAVKARDSTDASLSSGSYNYVLLTDGETTPAASAPTSIANGYTAPSYGLGETSIFYVAPPDASRPSYREIYAKWVNPDGTVPSQSFFLYNNTELGFTGDYKAFSTKYEGSQLVRLLIQPIVS